MAITPVIPANVAAVSGAGTEFVTSGPFMLYGDDLAQDEVVVLTRLGPSGTHRPMTNKDGAIYVAAAPNSVLVEAAGTFRLIKPVTAQPAAIGYEVQ